MVRSVVVSTTAASCVALGVGATGAASAAQPLSAIARAPAAAMTVRRMAPPGRCEFSPMADSVTRENMPKLRFA